MSLEGSYIETPPILKPLKRSILNVVNKRDHFCFLYCIAAATFSSVARPHSPKRCCNGKKAFRLLRVSQQQRMRMLTVHKVFCCLCGKDVERASGVIHLCHLSGTLFGMAHSKCNFTARTTISLPVFFHNLSRYDAHYIPKQLKLKVSEELSAIAKTDETFISFSVNMPVGSYRKKCGKTVKLFQSMGFIDIYQSVSQSLDNLAKTLKTGDFLV